MKLQYIIIFCLLIVTSCDVEYLDNPNEVVEPPTSGLFNNATKNTVDELFDEWFSGRFTYVMMQYWTQTAYANEDRYQFRDSQRETWGSFYRILESYRKVIYWAENPETQVYMKTFGDLNNQIQQSRIMMAYLFNIMADTWGDIPYYAYGSSDNSDFQALHLDQEDAILFPKYALQKDIYTSILNELEDAAKKLDASKPGIKGDKIYFGDVSKWKKFANSLRLRVALKIKVVEPGQAQKHIDDALSAGVFTSNDDNAQFSYASSDINASPIYRAYNVSNRSDFGVSHSLVELLKGHDLVLGDSSNVTTLKVNPFNGVEDPRLAVYASPNKYSEYVGMPIADDSDVAGTIDFESLPGQAIINKPDYKQTLMSYSEVLFIQSELNNWDQGMYENAVKASLERWGISPSVASEFITKIPSATQETVLTQKYIDLYMDGHTAWQEYRRTGYPKFIVLPGTTYTQDPLSGGAPSNYTFTSLVSGVVDIPNRMKYPSYEQTLNNANYEEAVARLSHENEIFSSLWWDIN